MSEILAYMPTFAPNAGDEPAHGRPLSRLTLAQITDRINTLGEASRTRPYVYMDAIDSVISARPDIQLVVGDAKSSDIVRTGLATHHKASGGYELAFYPDKMSQWALMNDVMRRYATSDTKYVIYTSSDIIWPMDWVAEAIAEFDKDPALMIVFPTVSRGDMAIPIQVASGPVDVPLIDPADYIKCPGMAAARAPCLNAYAIIFRADFFKTYGGYMDEFKNCFTESFLYYQCEAMGGKMRLCPKAWVYHHNGVDVWVDSTGFYGYASEKPKFDKLMDEVLAARSAGTMTVDFLRTKLYIQQK